MATVDAKQQEEMKRVTSEAREAARKNGHQMSPWKWEEQTMSALLVSGCESCGAEIVVVPHQNPIRVWEERRRALDWNCPN